MYIVFHRWEAGPMVGEYRWVFDTIIGPFDSEMACYAYLDRKFPGGLDQHNLKATITTIDEPNWE
jgi:hypothetical protein